MKRYLYAVLVLILIVSLSACRKEQDSLEQMQEPISMESLTIIGSEAQTPAAPETKSAEVKTALPAPAKTELLLVQPMASKPAVKDIQAALLNAGFYKGVVDGKSGPMTKKAITEFQKANGLEADGKVGARTWAVLGAYLTKEKSR